MKNYHVESAPGGWYGRVKIGKAWEYSPAFPTRKLAMQWCRDRLYFPLAHDYAPREKFGKDYVSAPGSSRPWRMSTRAGRPHTTFGDPDPVQEKPSPYAGDGRVTAKRGKPLLYRAKSTGVSRALF